jgi:hypothetical protein
MHRRLGAPLCVLAIAASSALAVTPTAAAAPPVNACGETGFDPSSADRSGSTLPGNIDIRYPWPQIVPVPLPDPPQDQTRIPQEPLPADPCADPCPDLTDPTPEPEPDT